MRGGVDVDFTRYRGFAGEHAAQTDLRRRDDYRLADRNKGVLFALGALAHVGS